MIFRCNSWPATPGQAFGNFDNFMFLLWCGRGVHISGTSACLACNPGTYSAHTGMCCSISAHCLVGASLSSYGKTVKAA